MSRPLFAAAAAAAAAAVPSTANADSSTAHPSSSFTALENVRFSSAPDFSALVSKPEAPPANLYQTDSSDYPPQSRKRLINDYDAYAGRSSKHQKKEKERDKSMSKSKSKSKGEGDAHSQRRTSAKEKKPKKERRPQKHEPDRSKPTLYITDTAVESGFRIDKIGDERNKSFQSLYIKDIPQYRRTYGAYCLGLSDKYTIVFDDRRGGGPSASRLHDDVSAKKMLRYTLAESYRELRRQPGKKIAPLTEPSSLPVVADYISLPVIDDPPVSVERLGQQEVVTPSPEQERTKQLNEQLRVQPNDVGLWLELIQHQDVMVPDYTKNRHIVLMEKKISIYEKAIAFNPNHDGLLCLYLSLCEEAWDHEKVDQKWQELLFRRAGSPMLWKRYLSFVESNFATFSVEMQMREYERCLRTFSSIRDNTFKGVEGHVDHGILEWHSARLFVRLCERLRQAGCIELAVAAYQGLLEFNIRCPSNLIRSTTTRGRVAFFESFWDSNVPRFGETGALGWAHWHLQRQALSGEVTVSDDEDVDDNDMEDLRRSHSENDISHLNRGWRELELKRSHRQWKPYVEAAASKLMDAERIVVSDDITGFLFIIKSEDVLYRILCGFIELLGVGWTMPLKRWSTLDSWALDSEYALESDQCCLESLQAVDLSRLARASPDLASVCFHVGSNQHIMTASNVPANGTSLRSPQATAVVGGRDSTPRAMSTVSPSLNGFVRQVLTQLSSLRLSCVDDFAAAFIVYETLRATTPAEQKLARKHAKTVLSQDAFRSSPIVWSTFAELSEQRVPIYDGLLAMHKNCTPSQQQLLWRAVYRRALLALDGGGDAGRRECLEVLVTFAPHASSSFTNWTQMPVDVNAPLLSSRLLRARTSFAESELLPTARSYEQMDAFVNFRCCYALFEYLMDNIDAARVIVAEARNHVQQRWNFANLFEQDLVALALEQLFQFECNLIRYHSVLHVCPLAALRDCATNALTCFPNNTYFQAYLIENEKRSRVAGHVRRVFNSLTRLSHSPVAWQMAILAESDQLSSFHKIESLLSRAFASTSESVIGYGEQKSAAIPALTSVEREYEDDSQVHKSVMLWRTRLAHAHQTARGIDHLKPILFAALQHCPWSKVLYLDGVAFNVISASEACDLMIEKGLHVRCFVEEVELLNRMSLPEE